MNRHTPTKNVKSTFGTLRFIVLTVALSVVFGIAGTTDANAQMWRVRLCTEEPDTTFKSLILPSDTLATDTTAIVGTADTAAVVINTDSLLISPKRYHAATLIADSVGQPVNTLPFMSIFIPQNDEIEYTPTDITRQRLTDYQNSVGGLSSMPAAGKEFEPQSDGIAQLRYNQSISSPGGVQYTWGQLPEPAKEIREGRKIKRDKDGELREIAESLNEKKNNKNLDGSIRNLPEKEKSPWTISGEENVQLSQLYLDNWIKGGESSTTLTSDLRFKAVYSKDKQQWESNITHKLGVTRTSTLGTRLSDDVLDINSKYGYQAISNWYYSFLTTFKTQLFKSYDKDDEEKTRAKSAFMSPAYIQFVFGMDYKKNDFSILLSPYTMNLTVVTDTVSVDKSNYSIKDDKKARLINGASITLNWKKKIATGIFYTTKAEMFYEYFEKQGSKRFDWENIIDLQVNRFLSTRLLFELRYFDNESDKFQIKENFSIAFKYSF